MLYFLKDLIPYVAFAAGILATYYWPITDFIRGIIRRVRPDPTVFRPPHTTILH